VERKMHKRVYDERNGRGEAQEGSLMERQLPDNFTVKRKLNSIQGSFGVCQFGHCRQ
jgi:hypothetical protein